MRWLRAASGRRSALPASALFMSLSCGGGDTPPCGPSEPCGNQAPGAVIAAPGNGASFTEGEMISFSGSGTDAEDGALSGGRLVWRSDADGQIGTGTSFSRDDLGVGTHAITLTATDSDGANGSATTSITVEPNQPPIVSINAPDDGASFVAGTTISFGASAIDTEDGVVEGSRLVWTSSSDGEIGTGVTFARDDLSVGEHTITATATDSHGASATDQATITIVAAVPPTVQILSPGDGSSFLQGEEITFEGTAEDATGGSLTGASLVWSSNLNGQIGNGATFTHDDLSVGDHVITLTATDGDGQTGMATVAISVASNSADSVEVLPHFATIQAAENLALTVETFASGAPVDDPSLVVTSRDAAVASVSETTVTGEAVGVTDVVATASGTADSARVAVVQTDGFAVLVAASGDDFASAGGSGQTVTLSLWFVRPAAGTGELGSIQGQITWDPAVLSYQSSAGLEPGWSWFPNEASVGAGELDFSAFTAGGTSASFAVAAIDFTVAGNAGQSSGVTVAIDVAGDPLGGDITGSILEAGALFEAQ